MCKKTTVLYDDTFSQERDDEVRNYTFFFTSDHFGIQVKYKPTA